MDQSNVGDHIKHDSMDLHVGIFSVPHGPETRDNIDHKHDRVLGQEDTTALRQFIYPNDTYTPNGVYWADLPFREQLAFNTNVDKVEIRKDLSSIWLMMRKDLLSPIGWYFKNAILPGAGLGLEG